ncbi:ATP synthase subunit beta [Bienertia sinuspersici]
MQASAKDFQQIPDFAKDFSPPIYPLGDKHWKSNEAASFINIYTLQVTPSPAPPLFASQTVIACFPLMIHLQEESCLRICSFLADGIVVNPGSVLSDLSINSLMFTLKELELTVPLDAAKAANSSYSVDTAFLDLFAEAKVHVENLVLSESPALCMGVLDLEKDPACFCLWNDQPIDASQKKWSAGASYISLSLETSEDAHRKNNSFDSSLGSWKCVEVKEARVEVAMATLDGSLLLHVPPPGGIARVGIACKQYCSNTSVDQLFFVLNLYGYFGKVSEKIALVGNNNKLPIKKSESWNGELISKAPSDTAVSFSIKDLQLRFLEDSCSTSQGKPLVQFVGENLFIKVGHRTLGGVIAISSTIQWESVEVDCVDVDGNSALGNGPMSNSPMNGSFVTATGYPQLRAVLWVEHKGQGCSSGRIKHTPFLNVNIVHVIPSQAQDAGCHSLNVSACVEGIRLGGGTNYAEALLHRFGILGPDGGPSAGLLRGLENLSDGPLSKVFKAPPHVVDYVKENDGTCETGHDSFLAHLRTPNDVDVSVDLKNWLFALEGTHDVLGSSLLDYCENANREDRCWHTIFKSLKIKATNSPKDGVNSSGIHVYPVELITIGVEGLQTLKPQVKTNNHKLELPVNASGGADIKKAGGVNVEARMVVSEDDIPDGIGNWTVENLKFSVEQPIEAVVTKNELQHLAFLCKSEVDSLGRLAASILRLLKLEGSIGPGAINQLSNLGSEGLDKFFSPRQLNRSENGECGPFLDGPGKSPHSSKQTTVTLLEKEVEDTESKCAALIADITESQSLQHLDQAKKLGQQIESLRRLLKELKTQS